MRVRSLLVLAAALALPLTATACREGGPTTTPKAGVVQTITPGSAACLDKGARSTGVTYQPDGLDQFDKPFPTSVLCVTPEVAANLTVGGRVQG
jgi:hypothetical protein